MNIYQIIVERKTQEILTIEAEDENKAKEIAAEVAKEAPVLRMIEIGKVIQ